MTHKFNDAVLVVEFFFLSGIFPLIQESDTHPGVEESKLAHAVREVIEVELDPGGKNSRVRKKGDLRSGPVRVGEVADDGELFRRDPALERDVVNFSISINIGGKPVGEGVDALRPDAVEAAREFISALAELAAGVEICQNEFDRGDSEFRVRIDGNTASVVLDGNRAVGVDRDRDEGAVAGKMLIDRVVEHFENGVVETAFGRGIANVHPGAFPHGLKAFEFVNLTGIVISRGFGRRVIVGRV